MKRTRYQVDCSLANAPCVIASYDVVDPVTGETKAIVLSFVDDDARQIVPMKPNPNPAIGEDEKPLLNADGTPFVSLIVDDDAPPNLAKLDELAAARLAEATGAAASVTERLVQAEAARRVLRDAEIGAQHARDAQAASEKRKAELEAQAAELEQKVAELQAAVTPTVTRK